jgi:hypothetical protein
MVTTTACESDGSLPTAQIGRLRSAGSGRLLRAQPLSSPESGPRERRRRDNRDLRLVPRRRRRRGRFERSSLSAKSATHTTIYRSTIVKWAPARGRSPGFGTPVNLDPCRRRSTVHPSRGTGWMRWTPRVSTLRPNRSAHSNAAAVRIAVPRLCREHGIDGRWSEQPPDPDDHPDAPELQSPSPQEE